MLVPDLYLSSIFEITPDILKDMGVVALILDVDNTLREYRGKVPYEGVEEWIAKMREAGIQLIVASNNFTRSIQPFALTLDLNYVAMSLKPLPFGLRRALKILNIDRDKVAVVGDQIFTDIFGGKLNGFKTILVEPFIREKGYFWKIKRLFEKPFISRYDKGDKK